jgi:hydroxysqualene dehydroxylase
MIDCAILGGGIAGLTAALELSRAGRSLVLCESRSRAGGRAASFIDRVSGIEYDNGQHLMMGCYTATLRLLATLGTHDCLGEISPMRIPFVRPGGRRAELRGGRLPHPLGLMQAFLGYSFLSVSERLSVLRVAMALRSLRAADIDALDGMSAAQWLSGLRQSSNTVESLWRPIVLATMNTDLPQASAKLLATVLREIFLSTADASTLLLPSRALSRIFADPACESLRKRGVELSFSSAVESIRREEDGAYTIHRRNAAPVRARQVVSALPPWALRRLLVQSGLEAMFPPLDAFTPSEIVSVHLRSRVAITETPMTGLLGTATQWLFLKEVEQGGVWRYSCTISSASDLDPEGTGFEQLVINHLRAFFPHFTREDVLNAQAIRERAATYIPRPGMERHRPHALTSMPGFYLAGDWTATGLPATIESAARSGYAAAEVVLAG